MHSAPKGTFRVLSCDYELPYRSRSCGATRLATAVASTAGQIPGERVHTGTNDSTLGPHLNHELTAALKESASTVTAYEIYRATSRRPVALTRLGVTL